MLYKVVYNTGAYGDTNIVHAPKLKKGMPQIIYNKKNDKKYVQKVPLEKVL